MIVDAVTNMHRYASVLPFAEAVEQAFLARNPDRLPFEVRVKTYFTRPDPLRSFEVHHHTIDCMIGLSGAEVIHICPSDGLMPGDPLPQGGDGRKLLGPPQGHTVLLRPGFFVAIFPGEAHMVAGIVPDTGCAEVSKWVVKISE